MKDPGLFTVVDDWQDVSAPRNVLRYVREGQAVALLAANGHEPMETFAVIVPIEQYRKMTTS